MRIYEVRISHGARVDMVGLRKFLKAMMTGEHGEHGEHRDRLTFPYGRRAKSSCFTKE